MTDSNALDFGDNIRKTILDSLSCKETKARLLLESSVNLGLAMDCILTVRAYSYSKQTIRLYFRSDAG